MFKHLFTTLFVFFIGFAAFSQGKIRGEVKDIKTGDPIPFAKVKVKGQNKGAETDFDGLYVISIAPGTYTLIYSATLDGFIDQEVEGVIVKEGEVTVQNFDMTKDSSILVLEGAVVKAKRLGNANTVAKVFQERSNSSGATDGVSSEQAQEQGAGDAAETVALAPGISIVGGKNVYVRGLGDRYTKTILNGMEIPGLDPDRNSVQLDIFPSTIIDNITVYKTFLPNLTGEFTGGLVDIKTKEFPLAKKVYFSAGLGYNQRATFNPNYIGYKGGSLDFLGFDDGTRKLPFSKFTLIPDPSSPDNTRLEGILRQFNPTMAASRRFAFLDQNYRFSIGNQKNHETKKGRKYGYNFVLNYRNQFRFYPDAQFNEFRKSPDSAEHILFRDRTSIGPVGENDVLWSALYNQSFTLNKRNKVSVTLFHTQNAKTSASDLRQENLDTNPAILEKTGLQFTQRSISNLNVSGEHRLDSLGKWKLNWKLTPTYSRITDPDLRSTAIEANDDDGNGDTTYLLAPSVGSEVRRIYRDLSEINVIGRVDLTREFWRRFKDGDSLKSNIMFGAMNTFRARTFETYELNFLFDNLTAFSNDPDWYFQEENLWTVARDSGMIVKGQNEPANNFEGSINIAGAYVMNELPISKRLSATYGVRAEQARYRYTGENNSGTVTFNDSLVLNELSILPSVNFVYKINKKADSANYERTTNWRLAYTQTVARPSFKEKSIAQIYDPIQGRRYNGNIDLLQTTIHNVDARWEYFFGRTELISASAFYKRFINPIEIVAFDLAPNEVKPVNAGVANVYGGEFEIRKALFGLRKDDNYGMVAGANFTYVVSQIDMDQVLLNKGSDLVSERQLRQENAREGEVIGQFRPMYGQSPMIVNAFVTFKHDSLGAKKLGFIANLSYNVQGKRLAVIGVGQLPDVFEQPFHSLNFKASLKFGKDQRWKASLAAQNLLFNARRLSYESFGDFEAAEQLTLGLSKNDWINSRLYSYFYQGMTVQASIALTLRGGKEKK